MENELLEKYPWAANHETAIYTIAKFMGVDFETALKQFDERILTKVAKEKLELPDFRPGDTVKVTIITPSSITNPVFAISPPGQVISFKPAVNISGNTWEAIFNYSEIKSEDLINNKDGWTLDKISYTYDEVVPLYTGYRATDPTDNSFVYINNGAFVEQYTSTSNNIYNTT